MAKGQHLSRYQQGIVRRYYEHKDSVQVQRLEALLSDIALDPASDKLWAKAEKLVRALTLDPPLPASRIDPILAGRDLTALAGLMAEITRRT